MRQERLCTKAVAHTCDGGMNESDTVPLGWVPALV